MRYDTGKANISIVATIKKYIRTLSVELLYKKYLHKEKC
jgi:hypothetical protein